MRFHTITACKTPCNLTGGIGFPLPDGARTLDSGELGYGPTVNTDFLYPGGGTKVPITAAVDIPAATSKCAGPGVDGLVKALANGCVGAETWKTPKNLNPGLYTYFCRVHPFMRGAFRVKKA